MRRAFLSVLYVCFIVGAFGANAECQDTNSVLGKWQYRSGSFTDVHEFLPGGKMGNDPRGTWEIHGNQLIVHWPNGWANIYTWVLGASQLSGVNEDPKGQKQQITLTRVTARTPAVEPPRLPVSPTTATSGGSRTQEFHDICSDCGQKRVDLGEHDFCALTGFVIGGFNSRCNVGRSGSRWYMDITDPGPPDPWQGESQECKATCFTFSR